eukprot:GGOE01037729.1.p1 GENE.GGOE01037729.1~~GGOE01037729.1.p1  ORF type:complete len:250 (+),score=43.06 GGOE01037729.1:42-791(+)
MTPWPKHSKTTWGLLGCSIVCTSIAVGAIGGAVGALTDCEDPDALWMLLRTAPGQGCVLLAAAGSLCTSFGLSALVGAVLNESGMLSLALFFATCLALTAIAVTALAGCVAFGAECALCRGALQQLWVFLAASDLPLLCILQQAFHCSGFAPPPDDRSNRGCCMPVTKRACYPPGLLPEWQRSTCPNCYDAADNAFEEPCLPTVRNGLRAHLVPALTCVALFDVFVVVFLGLLVRELRSIRQHPKGRWR